LTRKKEKILLTAVRPVINSEDATIFFLGEPVAASQKRV